MSAFFAGLAAGGLVFGRRADLVASPLRLYAGLEIGVAVLAVAATIGLAHAAPVFARIEEMAGPVAWAIPFCLVGAPAVLMGGTLPVLVRALLPRQEQIGGTAGALYAANTAGAILGALLAPFALVPTLGLLGAVLAAALLNVGAALGALALAGRGTTSALPPSGVSSSSEATPPRAFRAPARLAIALYAIAGGIALGYEVVWSQVIVLFTTTRTFGFAVVLATYLAGLAAGAAIHARWSDRVRDPWGVLGVLIAAAGAIALLEVAMLGRWLVFLQTMVESAVLAVSARPLVGMSARFAVAAACIVLLPTILLGAAFPVALRLIADARHVGRSIGAVLALNTLGGIAGTLLTGFVLVPALGLVRTLGALAAGAAAVGAVAVLRGPATSSALKQATLAAGAVSLVLAMLTPVDGLARLLPAARNGSLVYYDESPGGTVAVVEQRAGRNRFRRLYIQGVSNSGDSIPSLRYMRLQALIPLLIHGGEPRAALVIGLGTGITAGALLPFPGLEHRVVAELLPAVVRAAPAFEGTFGVTSDPAIDIRVRDGRRELLRSAERYDVITLEPPPPSAARVASLYSTDFYALAAARLRPRGLLAQWLPLPTQNDEDTRSLVRSFLDVFPYASLWTTELHEMLLIGSHDPIELDVQRIAARFHEPRIEAALGEVGVGSPAALLATWVTDRAGLERYANGALPVTDDQPRIEYATWVRPREIERVLPQLLALRSDPPLSGAGDAFGAAVADERDRLLRFYDAGLQAYKGDREQWSRQMERVLREDGRNPYYRWFGGGGP